jgi:isopentenyl-diphosphate delta-isomerase
MSEIAERKSDHIRLAASENVGFRDKTTLFECVELVHDALPDLDFDAIDLSTRVLGRALRAPLLLAGMTGGTEHARTINRELASVAEERGYAFGLGSQRPMLKDPTLTATFQVRDVAPTTLVLGNVGMVQAAKLDGSALEDLVTRVGADALCVHLNPAMELIQAEGDRDFRNGEELFRRLVTTLSVPVIAKETGCGIAPKVARKLHGAGVRHIDVSGAGGTSWVAVETHRAKEERKELGSRFWDWGIPTAASVALLAPFGFKTLCATGGVGNGLEAAKALALGAHLVGIARPVLRALESGGRKAVIEHLEKIELELKTAMLLVGASNPGALREAPRVILGELGEWLRQLS